MSGNGEKLIRRVCADCEIREYCKESTNNPWNNRNILQDYRDFQLDLNEINKGRMEVEYYPNGKIKKITYYN